MANRRTPPTCLGRHTALLFTAKLNKQQIACALRHCGASRFAKNQAISMVVEGLKAKKEDSSHKVPWSGFDLINAFNAWKKSKAAGIDPDTGETGLPWRKDIYNQVFEEAIVDIGRALAAFSSCRKGKRTGPKVGFPQFRKKGRCRESFRVRNLISAQGKSRIRVEGRTLMMPVLGAVRLRECTRRARRMLRRSTNDCATARITAVTVALEGKQWRVSVRMNAHPLHPGSVARSERIVGIDRGLNVFAVVANSDGDEVRRYAAPKPFQKQLHQLKKANRRLSRAKKGSNNRQKRRTELAKRHRNIKQQRADYLHRVTSELAKTHRHLQVETLNIRGMMRGRLARQIADVSWGNFTRQLRYKVEWRHGSLIEIDRWYASSKICSACGHKKDSLTLSQRSYVCLQCNLEICRDRNAAINIARWKPDQKEVTSPRGTRRRKTPAERDALAAA